jgi:hypothetical protein
VKDNILFTFALVFLLCLGLAMSYFGFFDP